MERRMIPRTYDQWKTTNPEDEWLGPEPEEEDIPEILKLIVVPVDRRGRYRVTLGPETLVEASEQPFTAAARVLQKEGIAPDVVIEMWSPGETAWRLRSTVGSAAALTVRESSTFAIRHVPWKPWIG